MIVSPLVVVPAAETQVLRRCRLSARGFCCPSALKSPGLTSSATRSRSATDTRSSRFRDRFKLSSDVADIVPPTPDPAIYEAAGSYPVSAFEEIGTHAFRGYQILFVKLNPVEFVPATGGIVLLSEYDHCG